MSVIRFILPLIYGLLFSASLFADDNLYVFVFKEGVAQADVSVNVGEFTRKTDEFGLANFDLPSGEYEISYAKNSESVVLTDFMLMPEQQSQIFLDLTHKDATVEMDLPLSSYDQNFSQTEIKEQLGPKGTLQISLKNARDDTPIAGAKLYFKGYAVEALSDENGVAMVELSQGAYDISVIHPKFIMRVLKDIKINAEKTTKFEEKLTQSDIVMEEYVVSAPAVEGSLASTLTDLKESTTLGDAISSEQFTKSGDSSAAGALKRITGINIVDGKYVFIRGLGERYTSILLNGMHVPSPEPTKRIVPMDIFPSSVIQSMDIQKTFSSDLPGNFGGGAIRITTKDLPKEDNYIKAAVGVSTNSATGKKVKQNADVSKPLPGKLLSHSDNFGVLQQEVKLGDQVLAEGLTAEDKIALNKAMVMYRNYGLADTTIEPGKDAKFSFGQSFKTGFGWKYGTAGSIYFKSDLKSYDLESNDYDFFDDGTVFHDEETNSQITKISQKYGGLVSVGIDSLKGQELKYTLLKIKESTERTAFSEEYSNKNDEYYRHIYLEHTEENIKAHQLNGKHQIGKDKGGFLDDVEVSWGASSASATRLQPGTVEYDYKLENEEYVYDAKKTFFLYSNLKDDVTNQRIDFTLPFDSGSISGHTQLGIFKYNKERHLDNRRFKFFYPTNENNAGDIDEIFTEQNVDDGKLDTLDAYKPDDFYTAKQQVDAVYISQLLTPIKPLDIILGLRQESSEQSLSVGEEAEEHSLSTEDNLFSVGATWRFNDEHQMRFAYSNTLSRPDFREFSPNRYKHPTTGDIYFGYPELKYTKVTNLDLKYEWYPSHNELFTVALFSKTFTDHIETVRDKADVDNEVTNRNAHMAKNLGIEFGFRKNLQNLWKKLEFYFMSGNLAFIDSKVTLGRELEENQFDPFIINLTTDDRPMQGQAPYVLNLQFGYDNLNTRRSAIFSLNEVGETIDFLGVYESPDVYFQPYRKLDFVVKWGINDNYDLQVKKIAYDVSFKAKNLLDSRKNWTQGDYEVVGYDPGRSYSLSFSMKY